MQTQVARSAVKFIDIRAPFQDVFAFISEPLNWPRYAIVNLRSVRPGKGGWYETVTRFGDGALKIHSVPELGIFDHTWRDSQATWSVPARVVPNGHGSTVMMTIFKPPTMTDQQFDQAMAEMDLELRELREILENTQRSNDGE